MKALIAALVAAAWSMTGCEYLRPELQNPSSVQEQAFEDVPVPNDFTLDRESRDGFSYSEGAMRTGRLEYEGHLPAADVARFYRYQMPLAGWTARPATQQPSPAPTADGPLDLEFTKGRYLARIHITESRRPFSNRPLTRIVMNLQTD